MKETLSFFRSFFGVFIHPRKVIQNIIERDTHYFVWPFILAYSFLAATSPETYFPLLKKAPLATALSLGGSGTIIGMVLLFWAFAGFAYLTGKWMGGKGTLKEVMAAYVWCLPPAFIGILLNLLASIPTWAQVFSGVTDEKVLLFSRSAWQYALIFIYYVLIFWSLVLDFFAIAVAHRFSIWKSILIGLIATFIALVLGLGVGVLLVVYGNH
jgi:hypothetical protein